jgi:mannose-6-phosphate isomerase-like protein (cupin superfamily)
MKSGKVWGETALLLANPFVEVHRLKVRPQHRCSMHVHARKANAFLVLRGRLFVDVRKKDYDLTDVTDLRAGEHTIVPAGEWHRFRTGREG